MKAIMVEKLVHLYVNGYGAPPDPLSDGNLKIYLRRVKEYIAKLPPNTRVVIHLYGGYTNRSDLSEADAMAQWFDSHGVPAGAEVDIHDETSTLRDNLRDFAQICRGQAAVLFCEYSRRPTVRLLAWLLFKTISYEVVGVAFDRRSLRPAHLVRQYTVKPLLELLAYYLPLVDLWVRKPLRERHVAQARVEASTDKSVKTP